MSLTIWVGRKLDFDRQGYGHRCRQDSPLVGFYPRSLGFRDRRIPSMRGRL
jgi:hypothetical protein